MNFSIVKKKGFYCAVVVTLLCSLLGSFLAKLPYLSVIGALVIALMAGMAFQLFPGLKQVSEPGIGFISQKFLRLGIILLGFKLNLLVLVAAGIKTLILAVLVVAGMISLSYAFCRLVRVEKTLSLLAACGCGICGAAAVMGVSPQLKAKTDDSVLAVAVVAILGTVFTLIEVLLFPHLPLTEAQLGVLAGASLHEIAHAVAAGGAVGPLALDNAIITKLSRVLMLIPVALITAYLSSKFESSTQGRKLPIPYFMLGFVSASFMGTYLFLPAQFIAMLVSSAYIFLGMAMAALGLSVNFKVMARRGAAVLGACFLSSLVLLAVCILVARHFF